LASNPSVFHKLMRFEMKQSIPLTLVAGCALILVCGCSRPQVKPQNRVLIKALRTAVNTKQSDWLEKAAARVEASFQAGEMEDEEHAEFLSIIDTARSGKWQEAEEEVLRLAWAQRPTDEEIRRLEEGRHREHHH
jgi:hypothetical protein